MDDRAVRALEREARKGEPGAASRLARTRDRARGEEELAALTGLWTDLVSMLEAANAGRGAGRLEVEVLAREVLDVCDEAAATAWRWPAGAPAAEGDGGHVPRALVARRGEDVVLAVDTVPRAAAGGEWAIHLEPATFAAPGTIAVIERPSACTIGCCGPVRSIRLELLGDHPPAAYEAWVADDGDLTSLAVPVRRDGPRAGDEDDDEHELARCRVRTTRAHARAWALDALGGA